MQRLQWWAGPRCRVCIRVAFRGAKAGNAPGTLTRRASFGVELFGRVFNSVAGESGDSFPRSVGTSFSAMMRQFRGMPFEPDIRSAIEKLGTMLLDRVSIRLDTVPGFAYDRVRAGEPMPGVFLVSNDLLGASLKRKGDRFVIRAEPNPRRQSAATSRFSRGSTTRLRRPPGIEAARPGGTPATGRLLPGAPADPTCASNASGSSRRALSSGVR